MGLFSGIKNLAKKVAKPVKQTGQSIFDVGKEAAYRYIGQAIGDNLGPVGSDGRTAWNAALENQMLGMTSASQAAAAAKWMETLMPANQQQMVGIPLDSQIAMQQAQRENITNAGISSQALAQDRSQSDRNYVMAQQRYIRETESVGLANVHQQLQNRMLMEQMAQGQHLDDKRPYTQKVSEGVKKEYEYITGARNRQGRTRKTARGYR